MTRWARWVALSLTLGLVAGFTACDWEGSDDEDSWSGRYNWVNFSGMYRGFNGGVLITDYTATPGTPGTTNSVAGETIATAVGGQSTYAGTLNGRPVRAGSLEIVAGVFSLMDDGAGNLSGSGKSGSIAYGSGAWSIDLLGEWPPDGTAITASYQFTVSGSAGSGAPGPGTSGVTIYSFNVVQQGNHLTFTDSSGRPYTGKLSTVRTTGRIDQNSAVEDQTPVAGETVIADFQVTGTSSAGYTVHIVGTFNAVVHVGGTQTSLSDRRLYGTWMEVQGRTGDVNGEAAPLGI